MSQDDSGTALDELCPVCAAKPGRPCTYEGDLFSYARTPAGRVKTLVHRRGDPLASGVHGRRQGIVKARRLAGREPRPAAVPWKQGALTEAEIRAQYNQGYEVPEIARRAELPVVTVCKIIQQS